MFTLIKKVAQTVNIIKGKTFQIFELSFSFENGFVEKLRSSQLKGGHENEIVKEKKK